jgi:hypothetical protein
MDACQEALKLELLDEVLDQGGQRTGEQPIETYIETIGPW